MIMKESATKQPMSSSFRQWSVDEMSGRQNGKLTKWPSVNVSLFFSKVETIGANDHNQLIKFWSNSDKLVTFAFKHSIRGIIDI